MSGSELKTWEIKGWCPGALRPMQSGDGLVVRVRPHLGRLSPEQGIGIADAALAFGNGLLDLSGRANLQIRGVSDASHDALLEALSELNLLDADLAAEQRRNIIVTPFCVKGDDSQIVAKTLEAALATSTLMLPGKFGFAVDCGAERVLVSASADIRIERAASGGLIVRADGCATGRRVAIEDAASTALAIADWFVASGGVHDSRGRLVSHIASGALLPPALIGDEAPALEHNHPAPGVYPGGALIGLAFGQMHADTLRRLAHLGHGLRLTPWRMLLVEGLQSMPVDAQLVVRRDDPMLRVIACTGAPGCPQALGETRTLARALAPRIPLGAVLHVAGCAKGCAHPTAADFTLVATEAGFNCVRNGRTIDAPFVRDLAGHDLIASPSHFPGDG